MARWARCYRVRKVVFLPARPMLAGQDGDEDELRPRMSRASAEVVSLRMRVDIHTGLDQSDVELVCFVWLSSHGRVGNTGAGRVLVSRTMLPRRPPAVREYRIQRV